MNITSPQPTVIPAPRFTTRLVSVVAMPTVAVDVASGQLGDPERRITRIDGPLASLVRLRTNHSGEVTVIERFARRPVDDDEAYDEEMVVSVEVSVGGIGVRSFDEIVLLEKPDDVTPEHLWRHPLIEQATFEHTVYGDVFEWLADMLVAAGRL